MIVVKSELQLSYDEVDLYVRVFFLALGENIARIAREYLKIRNLYTIYELIIGQSNRCHGVENNTEPNHSNHKITTHDINIFQGTQETVA